MCVFNHLLPALWASNKYLAGHLSARDYLHPMTAMIVVILKDCNTIKKMTDESLKSMQ